MSSTACGRCGYDPTAVDSIRITRPPASRPGYRTLSLRPAQVRSTMSNEWARRRPLLVAPGVVVATALLVVADFPLNRVIVVAAVYFVLMGFQLAGAVLSRKSKLDERAYFITGLAGTLCHAVAIGATGGMTSPLWPTLLGSVVGGYIYFGRGWMGDVVFGVIAVSAVLYTFLPASVVGPPIAPPYGAVLTAWTVLYTVVVLRSSILSLSDAYRQAGEKRDKLREQVLQAAAARAQTLESISSKVAHELKNPLSSIKALGQLLARGSTEEKTRDRI
jgi:hypothetical protein